MIEKMLPNRPNEPEQIEDNVFVRISGLNDWFHFGDGERIGAIQIDKNDPRYKILNGKIKEDEKS